MPNRLLADIAWHWWRFRRMVYRYVTDCCPSCHRPFPEHKLDCYER